MTSPPLGLAGLIEHFGIKTASPSVCSYAGATRHTDRSGPEVRETYPRQYGCENVRDHLRFALRYEPLDLRVWTYVLQQVDRALLTGWLKQQPTSSYARRCWWLYENLLAKELPVPDAIRGNYSELADPRLQVTSEGGLNSPRHRIRVNVLGDASFAPLVRWTDRIRSGVSRDLGGQLLAITSELSPEIFARAARFLYLSETNSSYALEGETPTKDRELRFTSMLEKAGAGDLSESGLAEIQRGIVQDVRFHSHHWRKVQNYVGATRLDYSESVVFPCPRPRDIAELMKAWRRSAGIMMSDGQMNAVVAAACIAFGFVYLHPFEDGNGRIHRFLIHDVLAKRAYTPPGLIFPVSAAILRQQSRYDTTLRTVSEKVTPFVDFTINDRNELSVHNETAELYRYPDLTPHVEFLFDCVVETLENDWPRELEFLTKFDALTQAVRRVVEMPDAKLRLMVKLLLQGRGRLSKAKRKQFSWLTNAEIDRMESVAQPIAGGVS